MQLTILGTAAAEGWPALFCDCQHCRRAQAAGGRNIRTRAGSVLDDVIMIDFSHDAYMQSLRSGVALGKVAHLFITHDHEDHYNPDDLYMRFPPFGHGAPQLHLYGNERVLRRAYDLTRNAENPAKLHLIHHGEAIALPTGHVVTPLAALHDRTQNCFLFHFAGDGKAMLYGHDTGYFPEPTFELLKKLKLDFAMLDCTSGPLREGTNHMGLPDCAEVRARLLEDGAARANARFVVTHFSHNGGLIYDEMIDPAARLGFDVAYDGVRYDI